jgi:hypothetical protein
MSAKIRIEADTDQAKAKVGELDAAIKKLGGSFGASFSKSTLARNPELAAAMGVKGAGGIPFASFGGQEFPIEKFASKFGAAQRQMRQSMSELNPALKEYRKNLVSAFSGMQWNLPMGAKQPFADWKTAGMGGIAALFSPWIGARMLNQAFGGFPGMARGGGGNKGGGIVSGIFGAGGMAGFGEWYIFIQALKTAARVLTEEFTQAVKRGSELYLHAAMVGTTPARLSQIEKTFQMVGLPADAAQRLLAQGQFSRGVKMTPQAMQGALLGAGAGIMGREELQGLLNLSKEIAAAWNMTADTARQSAAVAGDLFRTSFIGKQITQEWQTFWEQLTAIFSGAIDVMEMTAVGFLHLMNMIAEVLNKFPQLLGILGGPLGQFLALAKEFSARVLPRVGTNGDKFSRQVGGMTGGRPESAWERMGLIIYGGVSGKDYARQTAENTKKMADIMSGKNNASSTDKFGLPVMGGFALPNLP